MDIKDYSWESILEKSFECYLKYGSRSNKKLYYPHYWIREKLKEYLEGDEYSYYSFGFNNSKFDKEFNVKGIAYNKKSDITILKKNSVVGVVSFKFISSNYAQNSNNYFENLLGECFNIQANNIPFCHILVIRDKIPYQDKNQDYVKTDLLKDTHLNKYFNLLNLNENYCSIPKVMCINIIRINDFENITLKSFNAKSDEEKDEILNDMHVELVYKFENSSEENENILKQMEITKILKDFSKIIEEDNFI